MNSESSRIRASNVELPGDKGNPSKSPWRNSLTRKDVPECVLYDVFSKSRSTVSRDSRNSAGDSPVLAASVRSAPFAV